MKKYYFFMTECKHWFDIAVKLHSDGIAKPILWLGDDLHYKNASKIFGKGVEKALKFVHRPYEIYDVNYSGENSDFFLSEHYLKVKDRCLKMMDRIDTYGTFSRIDREAYFNNLVIWALKKIKLDKPDLLIVAEAPHSHAQYLIYEICRYFKIPCYKFNNWMLLPCLSLENFETGEVIKPKKNISEIDLKFDKIIEQFVNDLLHRDQEYELSYMKTHRKNQQFFQKIFNYFKYGYKKDFNDFKHNIGNILKSRASYINPYKLNFLTRKKMINKRKSNLLIHFKKNISKIDLNEKYVYFGLHYEHERTTNPDGNEYHDQLKAIIKLRSVLDSDIKIFVKEHPSQFMAEKGHLGRSPIFYNILKNISGVRVVDTKINTLKLIKNSMFVSTITGTLGLEAAILGKKAIIFAETWYSGCPNVFNFSNFTKLSKSKVKNSNDVLTFLLNKKNTNTIVSCQNGSARRRFSFLIDKDFENKQFKETYQLIKSLFSSI
tara:strand:- start:560 stop:2029 length:1470 start_codon:yes stop_codon:yes gene_type:complete